MRWFLALFLLLPGLSSFLPMASANEYLDEASQLIFDAPGQLEWAVLPASDGASGHAEISDRNGLLLQISSHHEAVEKVLESLQLRTLQPTDISNYDILATAGVRIFGNTLEDLRPVQALVFAKRDVSISILYFGPNRNEFEAFLKNIVPADEISDLAGHKLRAEIDDAIGRGIFSGSIDPQTHRKVFRPDHGINRAELTKILVLASNEGEVETVEDFFQDFLSRDKGTLFPDVDRAAWFAPYIFFAAERGWVKGYADGTFSPGGMVNIAEAAKLILVSQQFSISSDPEVWFRPYLQAFVMRNILQEETGGYRLTFTAKVLRPSDWCTRAQASAFLVRLLMLGAEKGRELFGKHLPLETLPFVFSTEVSLEANDLGPSFRRDGREQTVQMLSRQESIIAPLVKIAVFSQAAWLERKKGEDPSLTPVYYLGETSEKVFAAESLCESLKTCTLPEAKFLKSFSVR